MVERYFCEFCDDECDNWRGDSRGRAVNVGKIGGSEAFCTSYMLICDNCLVEWNKLAAELFEKVKSKAFIRKHGSHISPTFIGLQPHEEEKQPSKWQGIKDWLNKK